MRIRSIFKALLIFAVLCVLLYSAYIWNRGVVLTEHPMGRGITDGSSVIVSANGLHAAFVVTKGGKQRVVNDNQPDKMYDSVLDNSLQFSQDGQLLVYAARLGSKEFLVVNHQEWRSFDKVFADSITISPDGKHVACVVSNHGKQAVVLDDTPSRSYDHIDSLESSFDSKWLYFSPDGKRLAFVAQRNGKQFVVLDGVESKAYDWVGTVNEWVDPNRSGGEIQFSPDSKHVAYVARKRDKWFVVMDSVQGRAYGTILAVNLASDGRLAYIAGTRSFLPPRMADVDVTDWWRAPSTWGKLCIIIDGHEVERFDWRDDWSSSIPEFSPDGKHVVFKVLRGDKQFMVIDGKKDKEFDEVEGPLFSPNSRRVAYIATINSKETYSVVTMVDGVQTVNKYPESVDYMLIIDGKESARYKRIQRVTFSPDSKRVAFMAATALHTPGWDTERYGERLRWSVVVDGKAGCRYVDLYEYKGISFSSDSRHVSYAAFKWIHGIKREIAVLDEKEYDDGLSVTFSAGGRRTAVACRVWPKKGLYIIVDDRKRLTLVDAHEASGLIKRYGAYLNIDQALFTRDGKHLAYVYSIGATHNRVALRHYIGMDGKIVGEYDRLLLMKSEPETVLASTGSNSVSAFAVKDGELLRLEIRPRSWFAF